MWQRFTERARKAVFAAQDEASERNGNFVGTEHLLLGMLRETDTMAVKMLVRMGVDPSRLREMLAAQVPQGEGRHDGEKELTPACKQVIEHAYTEARGLDNNFIGTEHLLLGLLHESEKRSNALAGRALNRLGVDLGQARATLRAIQEEATGGSSPSPAAQIQHKGPFASHYFEVNLPGFGKAAFGRVRPLSTSPENAPDPPHPLRGQIGMLRDGERKRVELTPDWEAVPAFLEMMSLRDEFAYREMAEAGTFLRAAAGTPIKVLASELLRAGNEIKGLIGDTLIVRVRLLEGELAGRIGYVTQNLIQDLRPDDRPFPPD